jgi:DnaJ-class molecular chaperone
MSKIGNYVVGLQEASNDCPECNGYGQVEVTVEVDSFRDEDCDMCNGTGKLEEDDE